MSWFRSTDRGSLHISVLTLGEAETLLAGLPLSDSQRRRLTAVGVDLEFVGDPGAGQPFEPYLRGPVSVDPVQEPTDVKYYPSDEPVRMGLEQFNRGNFGLSQRYFKDAVEKAPKDVTAWVGLAASYDRLRRFDLADQAYAQAIRLGGETVQILNDQGYSYMLRGNLNAARRKFAKAYELDPGNPTIANNLQLLNGSRKFIERSPDAL